ncbi:hypothetical protein ACI2JA_19720 [Alkalihalobacillus sp. NPDC078783]|uniref:hypothetical protein n=1 Tax=Streptomyces albidoflavus TaxID=1886 RepID=UPI0033EA7661
MYKIYTASYKNDEFEIRATLRLTQVTTEIRYHDMPADVWMPLHTNFLDDFSTIEQRQIGLDLKDEVYKKERDYAENCSIGKYLDVEFSYSSHNESFRSILLPHLRLTRSSKHPQEMTLNYFDELTGKIYSTGLIQSNKGGG